MTKQSKVPLDAWVRDDENRWHLVVGTSDLARVFDTGCGESYRRHPRDTKSVIMFPHGRWPEDKWNCRICMEVIRDNREEYNRQKDADPAHRLVNALLGE